jgi:hypothetical protein
VRDQYVGVTQRIRPTGPPVGLTGGHRERASQGVTERASQGVTERASQGVTERASQGVTERASQGVTERSSQSPPHHGGDDGQDSHAVTGPYGPVVARAWCDRSQRPAGHTEAPSHDRAVARGWRVPHTLVWPMLA